VKIASTTLAQALKAAMVAASDDPESTSINLVQLYQDGDKFSVTATDGKWCVWWQDVMDSVGSGRLNMPMRKAKFVLSVLSLGGECDVEIDWATSSIEADEYTLRKLHDEAVTAPEIERLFRERKNGAIDCVGFNSDLVSDASKAFKAAAGLRDDAVVMMTFGPSFLDPILLTCERSPQLSAIVMPCKVVECEDVIDHESGERRVVRKDTGEVIQTLPIERQTYIPGTEPDPAATVAESMRDFANRTGTTITIESGGSSATIEPEKKKRGRPRKDAGAVA
jgi:hypothetical protein